MAISKRKVFRSLVCFSFVVLLQSLWIALQFAQGDEVAGVVSGYESEHFEFDNGWWRLNELGQREARISQCGFYSSLFVLEYFERSFSPLLVSENLPVSEHGVALDRIQNLLQAHGLKTTGRKNVTFADLKRISVDTVAIVAIPDIQEAAHYYVVAPTKKGAALIDTPFGVALLNEIAPPTLKDLDERLASQGGIVLFVQPIVIKNSPKIAESIYVSPTEQDLGEFLVDVDLETTEPFRPRFEIQNTSAVPVAIEIQTSCGCVGKTNWKTRIIDAKGKETLEFEVSPRSWINGKKTEVVLLKFPDASQKFISITGTGHGGEGSATMKLENPSALVFDIGNEDARGYSKKLTKDVLLSSSNADSLSIKTNVSWLKATIVAHADLPNADNERICSIDCDVTISDKEIEDLCDNDNALHGKVTVTGEPSGLQVQFDVIVRRAPLIGAVPNTFSLAKGQRGELMISACENTRSTIKEVKVRRNAEDVASIVCDLQRIDDKVHQATISFSPDPRSRHQLIRFDVLFENGMQDSVTILASLKADE